MKTNFVGSRPGDAEEFYDYILNNLSKGPISCWDVYINEDGLGEEDEYRIQKSNKITYVRKTKTLQFIVKTYFTEIPIYSLKDFKEKFFTQYTTFFLSLEELRKKYKEFNILYENSKKLIYKQVFESE